MQTPWGQVETAREAQWSPHELYLIRQRAVERRGIGQGLPLAIAQGVLSDVVVDLETQVTPTYRYDPAAPEGKPGLADWITRAVVKPRVTLRSKSTGGMIGQWAPAGPPTLDLFPAVAVGATVGFGVIGWLVYRGLTRAKPLQVRKNPRRRRPRRRR